jgi:hypothetical protein
VEELHFETFISSSGNDRNYRGRYFPVLFLVDLFILSVSINSMFAKFPGVHSASEQNAQLICFVLRFRKTEKKVPDKEEGGKATPTERVFPPQFPAVGFMQSCTFGRKQPYYCQQIALSIHLFILGYY